MSSIPAGLLRPSTLAQRVAWRMCRTRPIGRSHAGRMRCRPRHPPRSTGGTGAACTSHTCDVLTPHLAHRAAWRMQCSICNVQGRRIVDAIMLSHVSRLHKLRPGRPSHNGRSASQARARVSARATLARWPCGLYSLLLPPRDRCAQPTLLPGRRPKSWVQHAPGSN